jgi:hypothetical protein
MLRLAAGVMRGAAAGDGHDQPDQALIASQPVQPLRPVAEILLELTRDRPVPEDESLAPYAAVAASLVPHWRTPGWSDPGGPVVVMAEAVLRILRWATSGAGAVTIVEDLHWADEATLATVRYLIDHADEVPVLVEDLLATGDLGGFPPRFAGTVRARLARLDDRHRAVVGAAAVLGRRFDWRLLDRAAGVEGRDVTEALHRCTALQLVTADGAGFAFRHALTREVVLGELAVPDRFRFFRSSVP